MNDGQESIAERGKLTVYTSLEVHLIVSIVLLGLKEKAIGLVWYTRPIDKQFNTR
jgi:hypothetical protein